MTGVHGNNICADVSSSLIISKEYLKNKQTNKVSFPHADIPPGWKRERSGDYIEQKTNDGYSNVKYLTMHYI